MISIIGFIVVLIPLVVVHEFGHFFFAKLFNVRADAFSVGFGPVIYKKQFGETEFRVSAIPLGGYVKLLGEDPTAELSETDRKRALHHQVPWKRFFIFFGGPLFNFIWAALVFMAMMAIGEPQISTVVGRVLPETPAAVAGFIPGDKITNVEGQPVTKFDDLMIKLSDKPGQDVAIGVDRAGQAITLKAHTDSEEGFTVYGEKKLVGSIDGLIPNARMPKVGVSDPSSAAAKAGFVTGDEIVSLNGIKISTFEQLEALYASWASKSDLTTKSPLVFEVKNGEKTKSVTLQPNYSGFLGKDYGLYSSELFVEQAVKDTPAEKAGLLKGDQIIAVSGTPIRSFFELRQNIQKAGEASGKLTISLVRQGKTLTQELVPQVSTERDPLLKKMKQFTIGIMPVQTMMDPVMVNEQTWNPFMLVYKGTERMFELTARNMISIVKMFQGQVSVKSLGGPILIGKLAGESLNRGILDFLKMMGILSIGLGVLNILPIPVLDGGHIVLLGIEAVRGRALSLKQIERAQQVGLVLILSLMVVVMKNDIMRLPIFN